MLQGFVVVDAEGKYLSLTEDGDVIFVAPHVDVSMCDVHEMMPFAVYTDREGADEEAAKCAGSSVRAFCITLL